MDAHSIRSLLPVRSPLCLCAFLARLTSAALDEPLALQSGPCPPKLGGRLKELSCFTMRDFSPLHIRKHEMLLRLHAYRLQR